MSCHHRPYRKNRLEPLNQFDCFGGSAAVHTVACTVGPGFWFTETPGCCLCVVVCVNPDTAMADAGVYGFAWRRHRRSMQPFVP